MPANDKYGQSIPYSLLTDGADAQALGKGIADAAAGRAVMRFPSAAVRGAVLAGDSAPQEGMVTYLADADRLEYYDGTNWLYLTPGPWQPLTLSSDAPAIVALYGSPGYRITAGGVEFRGGVKRNDGGDFAVGGGAETTIASLPASIRPSSDRAFAIAASANAMVARATVTSAGFITVAAVLSLATTWVDLSTIRYNLG